MAHTQARIEQLLQRHGDDLYRLALLLLPNASSAAATLSRAMRRLAAAAPAAPNEDALIHALLDVLPPERPRRMQRGMPEWVAAAPDEYTATCVALARLPRQQRLVLGLLTLQQWDAEHIAQVIGGDVAAAQALTRDALLALAPHAVPDLDTAAMHSAEAPEACRATRAALGMNDAALRHDPAVRGHLALCSACRAVEHDWQRLSDAVEDALRMALRPEQLSPLFSAQLQAELAAAGQPLRPASRLPQTWWRVALPLGIVALIALLVFPGARPNVPESPAAAAPVAPLPLVQRATANLYQPPASERAQHPYDAWHGQWLVRWDFSDNSYAMLVGDLWRDMASSRHRVQLVHEQGGGPFEFELAAGQKLVYYAATENYGNSLYPLVFDSTNGRLALQVPADEQPRMLDARLHAGAWGLARAYLEQAAASADLRSWGQQRTPDGATVAVLGFRGTSPLGLPEGATGATANLPTILLTIDAGDGTLREIRELAGPPGGEQIGRTIWRFMGGEWISAAPQISAAFSIEQAWNGVGSFRNTGQTVVNPALPTITGDTVRPLADAITNQWAWGQLPSTPPPGATAAMLFESNSHSPNTFDGVAVYIGDDRYLALRGGWMGNGQIALGGNAETLETGGAAVQLVPQARQQYTALVTSRNPPDQPQLFVQISAQGYSRAELLQVISGLRMLDIQGYQTQAHLFADPQHNDPAAFDALLGALATAAVPPNTARHVTARVFQRHGDRADSLGDPYHRPPDGGTPEEFLSEMWLRTGGDGSVHDIANQSHAAGGPVFQSSYIGPGVSWLYDATTNAVQKYTALDDTGTSLARGQATALRMLACGASSMETSADGSRTFVISETTGQNGEYHYCMLPDYTDLINQQTREQAGEFIPSSAPGPYLLDLLPDLAGTPLTTWLYLTAEGQAGRVEVRLGTGQADMLIESWELMGDEQMPGDQAPPDVFSTTPPPALISDDYTRPFTQLVRTVSLTEAVALAQTPLWQLPANEQIGLVQAQAAPPGNTSPYSSNNIFDRAVQRGVAVQLVYQQQNEQGSQLIQLYQGSEERFGAFLRGQVRWQNSWPAQVRAAGRELSGWNVVPPDGGFWTLFELDGTLIAVSHPDSDLLDKLEPAGT